MWTQTGKIPQQYVAAEQTELRAILAVPMDAQNIAAEGSTEMESVQSIGGMSSNFGFPYSDTESASTCEEELFHEQFPYGSRNRMLSAIKDLKPGRQFADEYTPYCLNGPQRSVLL